MHSYELTERGKIVIAIILVVLILVLPAAILAYKAWAQPAQPPENSNTGGTGSVQPVSPDTSSPIVAISPPPNGGGFNPPGISPTDDDGEPDDTGNTPDTSDTSDIPDTPDTPPPVSNRPSVDPTEGTLSFFFSPDQQHAPDAETTSAFSVFLSSNKNTPDSLISVEIPKASREDSDIVITAVISAFAELGVNTQKLSFVTVSSKSTEGPMQIHLSYITQRTK